MHINRSPCASQAEHTAISIYSKSQISGLFYLYSCSTSSSSWRLHLVLFLSFFFCKCFFFLLPPPPPLSLLVENSHNPTLLFSDHTQQCDPTGAACLEIFSSPPNIHTYTSFVLSYSPKNMYFFLRRCNKSDKQTPYPWCFLSFSPLLSCTQAWEWYHRCENIAGLTFFYFFSYL